MRVIISDEVFSRNTVVLRDTLSLFINDEVNYCYNYLAVGVSIMVN